jgi:hypothetical protein
MAYRAFSAARPARDRGRGIYWVALESYLESKDYKDGKDHKDDLDHRRSSSRDIGPVSDGSIKVNQTRSNQIGPNRTTPGGCLEEQRPHAAGRAAFSCHVSAPGNTC